MGDTDDTESMLVDTKSKITFFFFLLNLKILGFDFFFFFLVFINISWKNWEEFSA